MEVKTLYTYLNSKLDKVTSSLDKPNCQFIEGVHIIADEGKAITKGGKNFYPVKDENSADGWYEVDY